MLSVVMTQNGNAGELERLSQDSGQEELETGQAIRFLLGHHPHIEHLHIHMSSSLNNSQHFGWSI